MKTRMRIKMKNENENEIGAKILTKMVSQRDQCQLKFTEESGPIYKNQVLYRMKYLVKNQSRKHTF
jgi:hypothetical protein